MDTGPFLQDMMLQVGDFGPYQLKQSLLHLSATIVAGMNILYLTTVVPTPPHRCFIPGVDNETSPSYYDARLVNLIPLTFDAKPDTCRRYIPGTTGFQNCSGLYVYDKTYYKSSLVIDLNLVCDRGSYRDLMELSFMIGDMLGAGLLGPLADRYGRKRVLHACMVLQLLFGVSAIKISNVYAFVVILFFLGMFGSASAYMNALVLTMETVGPSKRTICGIAFACAYSVGAMIVAFWWSFIKEYWLLQIVYVLHSVFLLIQWGFTDESVRWLWSQGRIEEAVKIAERVAEINGREFVNVYSGLETVSAPTEAEHQGSGDLLQSPVLRNRILIIAFCIFSLSPLYNDASSTTQKLFANPALAMFVIALAEVPTYATTLLLMNKAGRRYTCSLMMLVGGISCVTAAMLAEGTGGAILVMLGNCTIQGSYAIIFIITAEIFPTTVRASVVGFAVMAAKFSGAVVYWLTQENASNLQPPTTVSGAMVIIGVLFIVLLPETVGTQIPQTLEDGERHLRGNNGYKTMWNAIMRRQRNCEEADNDLPQEQENIALEFLR